MKRFLDFFQDFITLCQQENWPNNETTEDDIKNAFFIAEHIEKCINRFQNRRLIDDFLSKFYTNQNFTHMFLKACFSDPIKYVLKKIIQSQTNIEFMDKGFKVFVKLFSEAKLELYLADLFLEAASKTTLLNNLCVEVPTVDILRLKCEIEKYIE